MDSQSTNMQQDWANLDPNSIPAEILSKNEIVKELMFAAEARDLESQVKLPYIIKDRILMSPGIWNGAYYPNDEIVKGFKATDWNDKANRSLFLDHRDRESAEWIGEVDTKSMYIDKVGNLRGDLIILDKPTAIKLAYGAKFGISPSVLGASDNNKKVFNFKYRNFSVVINPAIKTAWINNSADGKILILENSDVQSLNTSGEEKREEIKMADTENTPKAVAGVPIKEDEKYSPYPKEAIYSLSEKEIMDLMANPAFVSHFTDFRKSNPNATIADAHKAYQANAQLNEVKSMIKAEMSALSEGFEAKLNELMSKISSPAAQSDVAPTPVSAPAVSATVKSEAPAAPVVREMSDEQLDKAMLVLMQNNMGPGARHAMGIFEGA